MAKPASAYTHGKMNIAANEASFHGFIAMTKWGSLSIASGLLFLVLWFCTSAGFLAALISGAVVAGLGTLLLSDKSGSAAH